MLEFVQDYGLWILLIGAMFLMHRLGLGCRGGHGHGAHGRRGASREPSPAAREVKAKAQDAG